MRADQAEIVALSALAADRERWGYAVHYDADGPVSRLVGRTGDHEVWLISLLPGQRTDPHTHRNSAGAFTVVAGAVTERITGASGTRRHRVTPGQSRGFRPGIAHQLVNDRGYPAIVLVITAAAAPTGHQERQIPSQRRRPESGESAAA